MAYSSSGLHRIGGASGVNLWIYQTTDAIATVNTAGYFNDMSDDLSVGDVIFVHDSNTPTLSIVMVASNASSVVDVTDGTTVAMTDSD